jgi:peptidyl-prolyl cis-trans isomerase D
VLNVMRENLKHLKWVLWIVAISMLAYLGLYFQGDSRKSTAEWAALVDGTPIPTERFLDVARRQDDYYRQIFGAQYDQMKGKLQLGAQVVQQLVNERLMLVEAKKLGLEGSDAEVSRRITEDPSFRDPSGQFVGKERYTQAVARAWPGGVSDFERMLADEVAVAKWKALVTEPAQVTDQELERVYRERNDKAAIDYVVVPHGDLASFSGSIGDAELASYYQQHADKYRKAEGKKIRYLLVDRQSQLTKVQVTDDEVRAFYQSNQGEFQRPEQRRVSQILFRVPKGASDSDRRSMRDLAETVKKRVDAGEDFTGLARSMSQDGDSASKGGDMGWFGRGQTPGPLETAAFETPVGKSAPIVESDLGLHVVKVTGSRPAGAAPFEEMKDFLKKQLEIRKAQESVKTEAERIRREISSPADLDTVAAKEQRKVEEKVVSRDEPPRDLGPSPEFTQAIAQLAPGAVSSPLPVARGMLIAAATETVPAFLPPLADNRERVRTDFLNEKAQQAAVAAARRAVASAADFKAAAAALKQTVKSSGDLSPGQAVPDAGVSPELEAALFGPGTVVGAKGAVPVATGALAYVVTRRDTFDPVRFEAAKKGLEDELIGQRRETLLRSVLESLRASHKVEINEEVVGRVNG